MERWSGAATWSKATPIALFASSTSPIAFDRTWSLAMREPSARPVSPWSPVRV